MPERSVMDQALTDAAFSHRESLYNYLNPTGKIKVTFECDIYVRSCTSCSCATCWMPIVSPTGGYLGVVTHCLKIKNCHFEITWE